jgi:hypothetical protein
MAQTSLGYRLALPLEKTDHDMPPTIIDGAQG